MAGAEPGGNALTVLKRVIELCMPNLRHYYRTTRKARVVAAYASDGAYYADVQPLRNDDSPDPSEPVVPKVEIPVLWGGTDRGLVCPPAVGTLCDLSYYDGDPNYPRISNFRWQGQGAPACELNELVIQQQPGVAIAIDQGHNIITVTPGEVRITAGAEVIVTAPEIRIVGALSCAAGEGGSSHSISGNVSIEGALSVSGGINGTVNGCSGCGG